MSDRAEAIKQHLKAEKAARKEAGGVWVRRGACKRCGACCDARNINMESYREKAAEVLEKLGRPLSSICGNYGAIKSQDGALGCRVHHIRPRVRVRGHSYPPGCEAFPDSVEQWRLVMATCGYWFEWREDQPRKAGKARRRRG